tara:strand:- start:6465 stop:7589 length:1125 start_codon:yes stop_codon:yes gene_type:complete
MYQVYFYGMSADNGILGPGWQRSVLKLLGLTILYLSILKRFSVEALLRNFILKLPLIFFAIVTIFVSPFLGPFEFQALNLCLFMPLLAIDFNKNKGDDLFNHFFKTFSLILIIQIILDPFLKAVTGVGYVNLALIGGLGNPNSFGYLLLCSAIYCLLCLRNQTIFYFLCFASFFTGSLIVLVSATAIVLLNFLRNIRKLRFLEFSLFSAVIAALIIAINFFYPDDIEQLFRALNHSVAKFEGLVSMINGNQVQVASISVREEYTLEGLRLITDNPWSLLIGHPEKTALYTGDGWWLGLLVTHGLLWTMLFLVCNVYAFLRGFKLQSPEGRCSSFIIFLTCCIFLSNRILDYWPAAIAYVFVFAFVCNTKLKVVT